MIISLCALPNPLRLSFKKSSTEIPFKPTRVILQDFTGVPAVVDLASLRTAMVEMKGDPSKINPERIIAQSKLLNLKDNIPVIIMAARPAMWKGYQVLIKALSKVEYDFQCVFNVQCFLRTFMYF